MGEVVDWDKEKKIKERTKARLDRILAKAEGATTKGSDGKNYGLTHKQDLFARAVARGDKAIDAYEKAGYSTNASNQSMYTACQRLLNNPKVAKRIGELKEKTEVQIEAEGLRLRKFVLERLEKEATDMASNASARIKALELLGKLDTVGMFRETTQIKELDKKSSKEIEKELRDKLEKLLA